MKGSTSVHQQIINQLLALTGAKSWMRIFKRSTGTAQTATGDWVQYGIVGAADLWAIVRREKDGIGIHVEIEVKSGNAKLGNRQVCFKNMILSMGGKYIICRDPLITATELEAIRNEGL